MLLSVAGQQQGVRARPLPLRRGRILSFVTPVIDSSEATKLSLQWSFDVVSTIPVTTVDTDDQDAWTIPLEWSFLIDLDPADDVEGDP